MNPKGGKKGGKQFPRISLKEAMDYGKKLVSRTFTGPQPRAIIFKGVFNNAGTGGEERASALRQYGLLEGGTDALTATAAARELTIAIGEDQKRLLQQACLSPKVFKLLYDTFQGDNVSAAQLRQQAVQNGVHPDTSERCVELFLQSAVFAGLATANGDQFQILAVADAAKPIAADDDTQDDEIEIEEPEVSTDPPPAIQPAPAAPVVTRMNGDGIQSARAVIHVNVNLDSSLDTDKLEKQLALLRKYGAI